jgi:hypothetical protein
LGDLPLPATVTALDNCDGAVAVNFSETQSLPGSSCSNVITRVWTATDSCSNAASCTQTILVHDTTPPDITCPPGFSVQCVADVPPCPADLAAFLAVGGTASDNCDADLSYACSDGPLVGGICGGTITRTHTVTDDCGNSSSCTQTITVRDTMPPVLSGCPTDAAYQCLSEVPEPAAVTALDNCDGTLAAAFSETQSNPGNQCSNVLTRTWTATDSCSNVATCTQTITVRDTTPPVITCPLDITADCEGPAGAQVVFSALVMDNCDSNVTVVCTPPSGSYFALGSNSVACVATDCNGNASQCAFTVNVLPRLKITRQGNMIVLRWKNGCAANLLEKTDDFRPPIRWMSADEEVMDVDDEKQVTFPVGPRNAFYRLRPAFQ